MRKLFFCLLSVLINVQIFAQKLNMNGEKMVSSVSVDKFDVEGKVVEHAEIYFTYDNSLQLEKVVRNITRYGDRYKDILSKAPNGKLSRACYFNGKKSNEYKYEYKTDEKGLIVSRIEKCEMGGEYRGDSAMTVYNYVYDAGSLIQISKMMRYKEKKEWHKAGRDDMKYICFDYVDNNYYWQEAWSALNVHDVRKYYNTEMKYDSCSYGEDINDTNIDVNLFVLMGMCWSICLDVHEFELATEWCGLKSENIVNKIGGSEIKIRKDNKGNIVELIDIYNKVKTYRKVKLSYLY